MRGSGLKNLSLSKGFLLKGFLVLYYSVGLAGLLMPQTSLLFISLIPFSLLLSYILLAVGHNSPVTNKELVLSFFVIVSGFTIEAIGVNTGAIFGSYTYGNGLGWAIYNTPLIIGLNWLFLTYCTYAILSKVNIDWVLKSILSSILMVIYDLFLEQVAPKLNMWDWKEGIIPIQNYLAWFFVALLFQLLFNKYKILIVNSLALFLFGIQMLFFVVSSLVL